MLIIYNFIFAVFRAVAYITLDTLYAVFFYIIYLGLLPPLPSATLHGEFFVVTLTCYGAL